MNRQRVLIVILAFLALIGILVYRLNMDIMVILEIIGPILILGIIVLVPVLVYKDASQLSKTDSRVSPLGWALAVLFFNIPGWIVYLVVRPYFVKEPESRETAITDKEKGEVLR